MLHSELEAIDYLEVLESAESLAQSMGINTRRHTYHPDVLTVYGRQHTGLYQNGRTTKLRFWTRDSEVEVRITGTTGNDVETFDLTFSLTTPASILQGTILAALEIA